MNKALLKEGLIHFEITAHSFKRMAASDGYCG
jgi:hypothetical protein